jgi:hypothetical protein
MPLLTAKSFNFANGHPFNPNRNQRRFYIVHFERFNDCLDLLHQFYGETIRKTTQGKATLRMPPDQPSRNRLPFLAAPQE